MIKASKLQYEYRKSLNRINSGFSKRISVVDADSFLNSAKDIVFENFAAKFQTNKAVRNHLRQLETEPVCLKECVDKDNYCTVTLPDDFYMLTKQVVKASNEECPNDIRILNAHMMQSSDVPKSIDDSFWKPSWEFEETFIEEIGNNLIVYHNGEFSIEEVCINYLRKLKDIYTPSLLKMECLDCTYVDASGNKISEDQDFEIDSTFLWRKVVDVAVLETLVSLGEVQDYQMKLQSILTLDKIFIN